MSSPKQIKANRLNSKKSTGPKTPEGKATVSGNALKHGLLAAETRLPWENSEDLALLSGRLLASLKPEDELEQLLVDRIVSLVWRLRRAGRIETGIYTCRRYSLQREMAEAEIQEFLQNKIQFATEQGYSASEVILKRQARNESLVREQVERTIAIYPDMPELGLIFINAANGFLVLHRYETGLEKSLYKAMHELERIQARRDGKSVLPPLAIDVNSDNA